VAQFFFDSQCIAAALSTATTAVLAQSPTTHTQSQWNSRHVDQITQSLLITCFNILWHSVIWDCLQKMQLSCQSRDKITLRCTHKSIIYCRKETINQLAAEHAYNFKIIELSSKSYERFLSLLIVLTLNTDNKYTVCQKKRHPFTSAITQLNPDQFG